MSFWNLHKHKGKKRRSGPKHAADKQHHHVVLVQGFDSDGESSSSSSLPSNSSGQRLQDLHHDLKAIAESGNCDSTRDVQDEDSQCSEEQDSLRQLGQILEKTFKEVETIDAYVMNLRTQFDKEALTEQRFMSCICSAKIAREACCKRQIKAWKDIQHRLMDFCHHHHHLHPHQHHHHHHHPHVDADHNPSDMNDHSLDDDTGSNASDNYEAEMDDLLNQLTKLPTFQLVKKRLDPESDVRVFVEHWILQNEHSDGTHSSDEN